MGKGEKGTVLEGLLKVVLCCLFVFFASAAFAGTATVDAATKYQTISGFGASSQWVENRITSSLATTFWADDQVDGHAGLSIIRLGVDPGGSGNWGTACNSAKQALNINSNVRVIAVPWSPPAQWKNNGKTTGNNTGNTNGNPGSNTNQLKTANYGDYATYLTNFVKACKNNYGFDLYALSVQNEPDYDVTYDSCLWSASAFDSFIGTYLGPSLAAAGFNNIIMMPESFACNMNLSATTMGNANSAKYVRCIGEHLYGGGPNPMPASYSTVAGHPVEIWQTEFSMKTSSDDISSGIYYANSLHKCVVDNNYNAWCYWWLVNTGSDDQGLCTSGGTPTKRLYALGNYSKFVKPGYVRIGATAAPTSGLLCSAYQDPVSGKFAIVVINSNSSATSQQFNLNGLSTSSVTPWITNSSNNLVKQAAITVSGNSFTYSLPGQSVVSFVGAGVAGPTYTPTLSPTPVVHSSWRVNVGGDTYTDTSGNVWDADENFTGGTAKTITNAITNTTDPTLYQSERYGSPFTYTFNVPAGTYQVTMKYAETYQTASGARVFNVSINGTQVQANFDIFADSGAQYKADDKVFNNISPTGGQITIQVGPASVDNAQVCAIQIIPQPATTVTPTNTVSTPGATNTFTSTNTPVTPGATSTFTPTIGTGNKVYTFTLDYSALPADIFKRMITLNVSVGTVSSCNVTADGTPVTCTYTASTGTCSFSLDKQRTNIVVTAVNWTSGGTGAATKATLWENKKWAYSFTFDDNYAADYTIVYPYLSARGLRAGVGVVTSWIGGSNYLNRTQLDALFNAGWSMLNHSTSHPQSTISCSNLATYIGAAKTTLESWYPTNYKSIYFIYPYLEMGYKSCLSTAGYVRGAEGVDGTNYVDNFGSIDFYTLYRHGMYASVNAATANGWADAAASDSRPRWNIVFTHNTVAGSGTPGTYDTNQSTLESHINYVYTTYGDGGSTKNMWFAPSDEVLMYLYTRQNLVINVATPGITPTSPNTSTFTPTNTPVINTSTNTPVVNTPTFTPTLTPVVASTWRVNAGGTAYTDSLGNSWSADTNFSGGTAKTLTNSISNTADPVLYQSERYGSPFTYTFNVPAGTYQVTLRFAETYQTASGARVFNVSINGTQVLANFDIFADSGAEYKADDKVFNNIAESGGKITIQFGPASADNAQVCAIQIIPQPATPTATPTTPVPTNTFTLTPTDTFTFTPTNTFTQTSTPIPPTNTFTKTFTPVPPTNTPITPSATPTTPVPTNTPITPSPTPTTPVPTNTPITPSPTPTTPVPTNTPITPSPTPTTPVPTNTPITPSPTPTTPVPTNTPITPSPTPTTPVPTNTPITPSPTPTTPVPTNTPITPSATPTTLVPTNTPITPSATPTTPVPTNTPITPSATPTTPVPTNTAVPPTAIPTNTPVPGSGSITLTYKSGDNNNSTNSPHPQIRAINNGTVAVNLNNVEARYWFNCDSSSGSAQAVQAYVDWAGKMPSGAGMTSNIQATVNTTSLGSQTHYLRVRFTGSVILQPGEYVEVQARFNNSTWSNMLQSNDWSYLNTTSFTNWNKVTGYMNGSLVYGQEPGAATAGMLEVADVLTYPNPATSASGVNIKYQISGTSSGISISSAGDTVSVIDPSATATLMVYTTTGRLIWKRTIEGASNISTGEHVIFWDGKAAGGQTLATGIYTLKIVLKSTGGESNGFSRVIMVK